MEGKRRAYFPGANTPEGFYSYYDDIISQEKAEKIFCLKGGPGTGKSTLLKRIGEEMIKTGEDVDFLRCSSDPDSLDGILIRNRNIAMVDGTAPHVVDPKNPGAVDVIVNLGEYLDEDGLRKRKNEIITANDIIKCCYEKAFGYLKRAGLVHGKLKELYDSVIKKAEMFKITASIVNRELAHKELFCEKGNNRRMFAGSVTPAGVVNSLELLTEDCSKVYILDAPVGMDCSPVLDRIAENARIRGMDTESFYCPMNPEKRLEHLIIPEMSTAFVTSDEYHCPELPGAEIIDMRCVINEEKYSRMKTTLDESEEELKILLDRAVCALRDAAGNHSALEEIYSSYLDFARVDVKTEEILAGIKCICGMQG